MGDTVTGNAHASVTSGPARGDGGGGAYGDCACPTRICGTSGRCALPALDAGHVLPGGVACATATAPTPPPPNDTCASPRAITFPAGASTTTFIADTSVASDDEQGSCNGQPDSPETVSSLTLGAARTVTVTAHASPGFTTEPLLYLRSATCDGLRGTEVRCTDAATPGPEPLTAALGPGTYFVFVEGFRAAGAGPTDVTVTLGP